MKRTFWGHLACKNFREYRANSLPVITYYFWLGVYLKSYKMYLLGKSCSFHFFLKHFYLDFSLWVFDNLFIIFVSASSTNFLECTTFTSL